MNKILVTGGAGFIGSHTCVELISSGFTPIIVDNFNNSDRKIVDNINAISNSNVKVYEIDCNNKVDLQNVIKSEKGINGVIHFAAYKAVGESVKEPLKYYLNNVGSLVTLLEVCKEYNIYNIVFSSSCTVYGQPDEACVTESTPIKKAESPYGNTKQICEDILTDYYKSGNNIKAALLRYFNPIGAHPSGLIGELPIGVPNNLVPFITQTADGIREKLTVFGDDYNTLDGSCVRDFIHVVDLAKAHIAALKWLQNQNNSVIDTFNIGSGKGNSVLEAIKSFEKINDIKLNYTIGPRRKGDVEQIYANPEKANNILNWKTELDIDTSMKDAWNWQLNLKNW